MIIKFLGTGTSQGVPVIACDCEVCISGDSQDKRLRSSVLIENRGRHLVIDSGPDFRYQMLRENVRHLDAILYTHAHKDHIAGLDDVRAFNRAQGRAIDIYADLVVQEALKREFFYAFHPQQYFGVPQLNLHTIDDRHPFDIIGLHIDPVLVYHYKMPVLGFRMGHFAYITDAKTIPDSELAKLRGVRVLVLNALQKTPHISHLTLDEAITVAREVNADETFFTHIGHNLGKHQVISAELPAGMRLAYDGLRLEI